MASRIIPVLLSLALVACASTGDDDFATDEIEVGEDENGGKADGNGELRVRAGETSVWVTQQLERRTGPDGAQFVLRGRASRNITGGFAFVSDDPYGDFETRSARTWEVSWPADYVRSLADGANQFVELEFVPSSSRPDSLTLRAQVRPRLVSFSGSSKIYLTAELTPVVVAGETVYRLRGKTTGGNSGVTASSGVRSLTATAITASEFTIDLPTDQIFAKEPLVITARLANGATVTKTVELGLSIKRLGLTADDPYERWPNPTCTAARESCLRDLGGAALDTASCGEALDVYACASTVGVRVDDVAFVEAINASHTRTGSAAMRADYAGLAGADRVEQLQGGVEQSIEANLEKQYDRWYLGTAARDAMLGKSVDAAIAAAYAFPLDLIEPHEGGPTTAHKRQVAADALLARLATEDFRSTELGRSYEELVAAYRARHVASLGELRTSSEVMPFPGQPGRDVVIGHWLDAYVEVTVDAASGEATNVYIEID